MRFLVDECTGPSVTQWLREQGYDDGMMRASA
jgi:predicted nuclease of predicted toxin-antitoxin system